MLRQNIYMIEYKIVEALSKKEKRPGPSLTICCDHEQVVMRSEDAEMQTAGKEVVWTSKVSGCMLY